MFRLRLVSLSSLLVFAALLSLHYFQLRDGNTSTIPAEFLGKDYVSAVFLWMHADGEQETKDTTSKAA